MNRWYQLRRMRGAAFLILVGILALLNQWNILSWDKSWPLFLILAGALALAERAAWTADVREQQAASPFGAAGMGAVPPTPPSSAYWSPVPPSTPAETFVPPTPPHPDDPGREGR